MTRVLIVDDNTFVREYLRALIGQEPGFTVVAEARNGREAVDAVLAFSPDVIVMDVDMPVMDGIEATRLIMEQHPTPILIHTSSAISKRRNLPFEAIRIGALDIIEKPALYPLGTRQQRDFLARVAMLAGIHVYRRPNRQMIAEPSTGETYKPSGSAMFPPEASHSHGAPPQIGAPHVAVSTAVCLPSPSASSGSLPPPGSFLGASGLSSISTGPQGVLAQTVRSITPHAPHAGELAQPPRLIAIAASTGGPRALADLFGELPPILPVPILLVQHIGSSFVQNFADWLQSLTSVRIRVASDGEVMEANTCYLSPGTHHLSVQTPFSIRLDGSEPVHSCKPAADVLFHSVRQIFAAQAVGVVLTGIGQDGAEGLRAMREAGAMTFAQNEESSVVYGMPRRAIEVHGATYTGDVGDIASALQRILGIG